ncbi:MAG: hypothetical protein LBQ00_09775 [Syntrophobacterales bacterium]|nr:hypothetical protein [Syntrophobacterales bacterium]
MKRLLIAVIALLILMASLTDYITSKRIAAIRIVKADYLEKSSKDG